MQARQGLRQWLAGAALLVAAVLAYLPSFHAPFFLDDFRVILENPALHNVFDVAAIWDHAKTRFIASLTLAANYTLHGDSTFGYHLVNFVIHLGAGFSLWLLARALLRTPAMRTPLPAWMYWIPLIAVAIFLLHPLQTQAVTYVVQRFTSLMAMFYLATIAAYLWARLRGSVTLYLTTLAFLVLALFSKQTAATLPLALLLAELVFFQRPSPKAWSGIVAGTAVLAAIGAWLLTLPAFDIVGVTRETQRIGRVDYLATQMEVLWHYIGLFFLIGEQRLEYGIAVAKGFSDISTVAMALGHLAVIATGFALWRRLPLVAFGILFYYLAHLVESSFFPISDLAFEHRAYLPNTGLVIVFATALAWTVHYFRRFRIGAAVTGALLAALATSTYARNDLWADRIGFLQHEASVSPNVQRAWTSLGKELMREARFEEALEALRKAVQIARNEDSGELRPPTLLNLIFALHYTERNREAIELANRIFLDRFNEMERAAYFNARGRAYLALGNLSQAKSDLTQSARLNPSPEVVSFLAATELQLGNRARARELARSVLQVAPDNPLARDILRQAR